MATFQIVRAMDGPRELFYFRQSGTYNVWRIDLAPDCPVGSVRTSIQQFIEAYKQYDAAAAVRYARTNWTSIDAEGDTIMSNDFSEIIRREVFNGCNRVAVGSAIRSSALVDMLDADNEPLTLWECADIGGPEWMTDALIVACT